MDLSRSELLLGKEAIKKLQGSKVLLLGLGGVGSFCFESLVRSGVGEIHVVDGDDVHASNANRQLLATDNFGEQKTCAAVSRAALINPDCSVVPYRVFLTADALTDAVDLGRFDYIIDAIDTISVKIRLAAVCCQNGYRLLSAMGAGNRLDPLAFKVADIFETHTCPVCSVMRRELRRNGVKGLKVVFSTEPARQFLSQTNTEPVCAIDSNKNNAARKQKAIGSVSFVPSVMGLILASEAVKSLIV